jgi:putative peptide zinc metalloprotease protein
LDVRREIAEFVGLREVQQMRLRNLEGRRVIDPAAGGQIPVAQEALVDIEQRLEQRRRDEQRLTLISPSAGIVLPPPRIKALPDRRSLASWSGTPLDARNRGAFLTTGTPLCSVGDPRRLEAVAVVDQADMQLIRVGQPARLQLDSLPGRILAGKVAELSELDIDTAPRELLASGLLPAREGPDGSRQLIRTCYLVRIEIPEGGPPLLLGTVGRTKIRVTPQSLVSRLHRFVRQTVRFGW